MLDFKYYVWKYSEGLFFGDSFFFVCATVEENEAKLICDLLRKSGTFGIYTEDNRFPRFAFPCDNDGGYKIIDEDEFERKA